MFWVVLLLVPNPEASGAMSACEEEGRWQTVLHVLGAMEAFQNSELPDTCGL